MIPGRRRHGERNRPWVGDPCRQEIVVGRMPKTVLPGGHGVLGTRLRVFKRVYRRSTGPATGGGRLGRLVLRHTNPSRMVVGGDSSRRLPAHLGPIGDWRRLLQKT